jgi:hypothetical protein
MKLYVTHLTLPSYYVDGREAGWVDGKVGGGWVGEWRSEKIVHSDTQMEGRVYGWIGKKQGMNEKEQVKRISGKKQSPSLLSLDIISYDTIRIENTAYNIYSIVVRVLIAARKCLASRCLTTVVFSGSTNLAFGR